MPDFGLKHGNGNDSAALSLPLPASDFTDAQTGDAVAPDTFYYSCGNQNEPQGGCSLQGGQD